MEVGETELVIVEVEKGMSGGSDGYKFLNIWPAIIQFPSCTISFLIRTSLFRSGQPTNASYR